MSIPQNVVILLLVVATLLVLNLRGLHVTLVQGPETAVSDLQSIPFPASNVNATHGTPLDEVSATNHKVKKGATKILGFADSDYLSYALKWYQRLSSLGYTEHFIVAVDQRAADYFRTNTTLDVRWESLPSPPCVNPEKNRLGYRRQIFGRRWRYVYKQLQEGFHILMTDVDNVFWRYHPLKDFEDTTDVDIFHAFSTSYPTYVFEDIGLTVCGGMSWLRATPKVISFVSALLKKCKCLNTRKLCKNCQCDDQVVLNELLWKGEHKVIWDRNISKPTSLRDWQWDGLKGVSSTTQHRIQVWDRSMAYRGPMPEKCPLNNWMAMPLYVDRGDVVHAWDELCSNHSAV